jgi:hypothetical protein
MLTWLLGTVALAGPPALTPGRYGLYMKSATHAHLPVLGARPGASVAWLTVDVARDAAGGWQAVQTPCALEMVGAGDKADVRLSDGFIDALGTKRYRLDVATDATGTRVRADLGMDHVGYDPTRSPDGPPRRAGDPGVVDFESDGNPGATVIIDVPMLGEMEIYIAQAAHSSLHGAVRADGSVHGGVEGHALQQQTLGATNPLMRVSPRMSPDPAGSFFWMVPIPGDTGCDALASRMCTAPGAGAGCPTATADATL